LIFKEIAGIFAWWPDGDIFTLCWLMLSKAYLLKAADCVEFIKLIPKRYTWKSKQEHKNF